jgi:hypothetical protein
VALVFAGVIGAGWLAIVGAVYALRWWKAQARRSVAPPDDNPVRDEVPAPTEGATPAGATAAADPTLAQLERLVAQARPQLPDELVVHLYSIRCTIAQALPWLARDAAHEADLYTVRETVRRYLPDKLAHYLALPPTVRTGHPMKDGRTARQLLAEQLALLDEEMREIASRVGSHDVQAMLANGRFLEARFGRPDLVSG